MPYQNVVQAFMPFAPTDKQALIRELGFLRAELDDVRTKYAALLAKLDADAGVTDANYAATAGLAARRFTAT